MKKALVTGSEGMLGSALMRALPSAGILSEGTDIRSKVNKANIANKEEIKNVVAAIKPDIIIHAAAYTDVDGCEIDPEKADSINADGTKNISEASKDIDAFLIYISTDFVFDGTKDKPYTEKDLTAPINVYGKSKLKGENFIRDIINTHLVIRTSWLFGSGGRNFVDTIIQKASTEHILKVVDDQKGTPTYVEDLALAISGLISQNAITQVLGVLNITNSGACSWHEFAREIIREKGLEPVSIEPIKSKDIERKAKRPEYSVLDNKLFAEVCGKKLPSWQNGLSRYLSSCHSKRGHCHPEQSHCHPERSEGSGV